MSSSSRVAELRRRLATHAGNYARLVAFLGLLSPFLFLALTRYLEGGTLLSVTGGYASLVFLGYYLLILIVLSSLLHLLLLAWPRAAAVACLTLAGGVIAYLALNSIVYRTFRFHVDAFWVSYAAQSFDGIGISASLLAIAALVVTGVSGLLWALFRAAGRMRRPGRFAGAVLVVSVLSFIGSQVVHILAHERNDARFTDLTRRLPFYFPVTSHQNAVRHAGLIPGIAEQGAPDAGMGSSLAYPLRPMQCQAPADEADPNILFILLESWRGDAFDAEVTPHMHGFGERSTVFANHFSSGNATPSGVFSLFYGLHPTYWTAVKANSAAIHNPVLIDELEARDYAFGIFADSHFERHKIKDTIFRGIPVHEDFGGATADENDRELTEQLADFALASHESETPFFGFAFYKSTHFGYYYPSDRDLFTPARPLNVALVRPGQDPTPFVNHYLNAVSYVDALVGDLLARLEAAGVLDHTIVVITSDHGEEFDDNGDGYWGHTGNFTAFQTQVPLVVYLPERSPKHVTRTTTHVDLPPTLLQEGLGCPQDPRDYSNGLNLFDPVPVDRALVMASYVNHAIVTDDNVFSVLPLYVHSYKLWDIHAEADPMRPDLAGHVMREMSRFYAGGEAPEERTSLMTPGR
jgi:uncharacterized protein